MSVSNQPIKNIVVLGGGAAGWSAAVGLARGLAETGVSISVIDAHTASEPPLICASEHILDYHRLLGIREEALFRNRIAQPWLAKCFYRGERPVYLGNDLELPVMGSLELQHLVNGQAIDLFDCSLASTAARQGAFIMPTADTPSSFRPGLLLQSQGYRDFMRGAAMHLGVKSVQASVVEVQRDTATGYIAALVCNEGTRLETDLIIDHSDGLLWQGVDAPATLPSRFFKEPLHTTCQPVAKAKPWPAPEYRFHENGWKEICCAFGQSWERHHLVGFDHQAEERWLAGRHGECHVAVQQAGYLVAPFYKNTLAIGARAGFSASPSVDNLNLAQRAIGHLLDYFPGVACLPANSRALNQHLRRDREEAIDYLHLQLLLSRQLTPNITTSWLPKLEDCSTTLQEAVELFASSARVGNALNPLITRQMWINALWLYTHQHRPVSPLLAMVDSDEGLAFIRRQKDWIAGQLKRISGNSAS